MQELTRSILMSALVLLCVFGAAAQDKNSQLNIKYDKKNNVTTVRLKALKISPLILEKQRTERIPLHQTEIEVSYTYPGQEISKPVEKVNFRFKVSSSNYVFLRSQAAMAVLDSESEKGRAFALGDSDYKSFPPITNSIYEEVLVVVAPAEALVKMAKANSLQLYLGPVPYLITPNQLEALKKLAESLGPPPSTTKN